MKRPTHDEVRYSLRRRKLVPRNGRTTLQYRRDNACQVTVSGRQSFRGKIVLEAVFEVTAGGQVRLAYDGMTGEILNLAA